MASYILNLRHYLRTESEGTINDRMGGVLDYTLMQFAYNAMMRRGGYLSYKNTAQIYCYGEVWATRAEDRFDVQDIICVQTHLTALHTAIQQMDNLITPDLYRSIYMQLYYGEPADMTDELQQFIMRYAVEPCDCNPDPLWDVAELHSGIISRGGDSRTAEVLSFLHCLNLYTTPFIIREENDEEYNSAAGDTERLSELFRREQDRYREETAQFVIDYDDIMED